MMKGWIYALPKAQLAAVARSYDVDDSGLLDDLRRRMSKYIDDHPEEFEAFGGETSTGSASQIPVTFPGTYAPLAQVTPEVPSPNVKVMNQIRKWGCHFDGRDPAAFLERLQELRDGYGFTRP